MPGKVIIIGPAHPLRGGLASFDQRLCKQFLAEGYDCSIFSFSLQYPSFLFPGTTQYTSEPAPENMRIFSVINSIHPLNWLHNGNQIKNLRPDIVVVRFWLPFMGPALGTILRQVKKNKHTKIVAITDNVIPHEKRAFDTSFTKYFLKSCDAFITMSAKVMTDLKTFEPGKPARQVLHPLYDNFGEPIDKLVAREKLKIDPSGEVLLFFGFIRKYKGLDILLRAMKDLIDRAKNNQSQKAVPKLMIAGEFYEDKNTYTTLIDELGIRDHLILHTDFIPDSDVKYFLCAADVVVQPYRNATQSGVTPLAYHFEKPMIVTNVGSLPDLVPHEKAGLVCEPEPHSISAAIERYFELGEKYFLPHLRKEKENYSWNKLVDAIVNVSKQTSNA
ncbi:MAG: glycosyltransferase [Chitinophagaceae bacterium]|nr:glycosyltransferase [Chitinophagaceae bacterium]